MFRKQATRDLLERNKRTLINVFLLFGRMVKAHNLDTKQTRFTGNDSARNYTMIHSADIIEESIEEFMIEHEDFFGKNIIAKTRDIHNGLFTTPMNKKLKEIRQYKSIYVENLIEYGENNARPTTD